MLKEKSISHDAELADWDTILDRSSAVRITPQTVKPEGELTERVMPALLRQLERDGNTLTPEQVDGLRAIPATIEAMAQGRAGDKFLLSDLPMGMGKTTALAETTKAMLADPAYSGVGILILVNQLNLIKPLIHRIGLKHDDPRLAVRVGSPPKGVVETEQKAKLRAELKTIGNPDQNAAQLLITTQPMLILLYRHRPQYFHFQDKWREVVVWDEAASPAYPISITLDKIREVATMAFAVGKQTMANRLWEWVDELESGDATCSTVPVWELEQGWEETQQSFEAEWLSAEWALIRMQGQTVHIHRDTRRDTRSPRGAAAVVHYFETLPASLAPVLILDAYGHDRMFYKLWRDRRGSLTFLPRAPKDYSALTWHRATLSGGKVAHRTPETKAKIVTAGVAAHFAADGPVLNAIHKPVKDSYDVQTDIMEGVRAGGGDPYRDAFETWGNLTGINDYGDRQTMFVGGLFRKPPHHYKAIYSAAARMKGKDRHDGVTLQEVERSEILHELQQAVGRIAVRKNVGGTHPPVHVYLVATKGGRLPISDEHLQAAFPGSPQPLPWHPVLQSLTSGKGSGLKTDNRQRLLDRITLGKWFRADAFSEPLEGEVVAFTDQKVRRYLTKDEAFARALADPGLTLETRTVNTGKALASEYRLVREAAGLAKTA